MACLVALAMITLTVLTLGAVLARGSDGSDCAMRFLGLPPFGLQANGYPMEVSRWRAILANISSQCEDEDFMANAAEMSIRWAASYLQLIKADLGSAVSVPIMSVLQQEIQNRFPIGQFQLRMDGLHVEEAAFASVNDSGVYFANISSAHYGLYRVDYEWDTVRGESILLGVFNLVVDGAAPRQVRAGSGERVILRCQDLGFKDLFEGRFRISYRWKMNQVHLPQHQGSQKITFLMKPMSTSLWTCSPELPEEGLRVYHLPTEVAFAEAESKPLFSGTVSISNEIIAAIAFSIKGLITVGGLAMLTTVIQFRFQIRRFAQDAIGDVQEAATQKQAMTQEDSQEQAATQAEAQDQRKNYVKVLWEKIKKVFTRRA